MAHVWAWYLELARARSSNGFGVNPIGFQEISAWATLTGEAPKAWEVRLLRRIDTVIVSKIHESTDQSPGKDPGQIDMRDVGGVSALMAGLRARQEAAGM